MLSKLTAISKEAPQTRFCASELEALREATRRLHSTLSTEHVLRVLVDTAVTIGGAEKCRLIVQGQPAKKGYFDQLRPITISAPVTVGSDPPPSVYEICNAVSHQEAVKNTQAYIPIEVDGDILGILYVEYRPSLLTGPARLTFFYELVREAALAIRNACFLENIYRAAREEAARVLTWDLHDLIIPSLQCLMLAAETTRQLVRDENGVAERHLAKVVQMAQETLQQMRQIINQRRLSIPEAQGFAETVRQRLRAFEQQSGIRVKSVIQDIPDLSPLVEYELLCVLQEALNNVLNHATATTVTVGLWTEDKQVVLEIQDDGKGFDPSEAAFKNGLGLTTMRKRTERLGGLFTVLSRPNYGTRITVLFDTSALQEA